MRGGDEHVRVVALQDRLGARLVIVPGVAVEEQDAGRLDTEPLQHPAECRDLLLVERRLDLALGQHPLLDLEPQRPLDQRLVLLEEQIVGIRPVDAADLVDVAEALGDQQRGPGALALEDGVDGDGGAVEKQSRGPVVAPGLVDPGIDAFDQPSGVDSLAERQIAGPLIEGGDIREGAADIGGEAKAVGLVAAGISWGWWRLELRRALSQIATAAWSAHRSGLRSRGTTAPTAVRGCSIKRGDAGKPEGRCPPKQRRISVFRLLREAIPAGSGRDPLSLAKPPKHLTFLVLLGEKYLLAAGTKEPVCCGVRWCSDPGAPRGRHGRMNRSQENSSCAVWRTRTLIGGREAVRTFAAVFRRRHHGRERAARQSGSFNPRVSVSLPYPTRLKIAEESWCGHDLAAPLVTLCLVIRSGGNYAAAIWKPSPTSRPTACHPLRSLPKRPTAVSTAAAPPSYADLLNALQAMRVGDFSVRMSGNQVGLLGKIADTFNEIVASNERMAQQLERVGHVVGREGKTRQRVKFGLPAAPGARWKPPSTR